MRKYSLHLLLNYCRNHWHALSAAALEMKRSPWTSALTISVIAVALLLPYSFYSLLTGLQPMTSEITTQPHILVYASMNSSTTDITQLHTQLEQIPNIKQITYTSPEDGLSQFIHYTKLNNILSSVGSNPLPAVFSLTPILSKQTPSELELLTQRIQQLPHVQLVQLNMTWLKRLFYLIHFAHRIIIALGAIFFLAVILVVGNTIRLMIQRHQADIQVMRLFGASASFIRRPLLYRGILLGLFGSAIAWLSTILFLWWLTAPLNALAQTYSSSLSLNILNFPTGIALIVLGVALSTIGAWLAITPHLQQPIE